MSKASINANCVSALAAELALAWQGTAAPDEDAAHNFRVAGPTTKVVRLGLEQIVGLVASSLAVLLDRQDECLPPLQSVAPLTSHFPSLRASFEERLRLGALQFVSLYQERLTRQGLTRHSKSGLLAFFLSAMYETLLFDHIETPESQADQGGGRRKKNKRRGAAYFTPPSLAYFAVHQALSKYFAAPDPGVGTAGQSRAVFKLPLPTVCDPAMGTALYLVAALDYLRQERPQLSPSLLAQQCLYGVDFDATTCSVARNCLNLAAGSRLTESADNLSWADGLVAGLPLFDVVLSNPPWDTVKKTKTAVQKKTPSRVNKARSNSLRQTFSHQGEGDTSYYKLFLERSVQLLKPGGVAAVLTPSALCGDKGAGPLRSLLIDNCNWLSVDGFINEDNAFAIHPHFKYLLLCFKKGGTTEAIKTRFGLVASRSPLVKPGAENICPTENISQTENNWQFIYEPSLIRLLGGEGRAILEIEAKEDLELLAALYKKHSNLRTFLHGNGHFFRREFDMTLDRHRFITPERAGQLHLRVNTQRHFLPQQSASETTETYLPLLEGRMIGQFDPARNAAPGRFFLKASDYRHKVPYPCPKVGFISITSPFNTRSMIASYLPDLPAGNSLPTVVFQTEQDDFLPALEAALYTTAIFNSFVFDWLVRTRLAGNNLSYHLLEELPFPQPHSVPEHLLQACVVVSALLSLCRGDFAREFAALNQVPFYRSIVAAHSRGANLVTNRPANPTTNLLIDDSCLLRLRLWLELIVCEIYGLSSKQLSCILRDCHWPVETLRLRRRLNRDFDCIATVQSGPGQRSFFRVDKELDPELRLSNLLNVAFTSLKSSPDDFIRPLINNLSFSQPSLPLPGKVEQSLAERSACMLPL